MRVLLVAAVVLLSSSANAQDGSVRFWTPNANTCAEILPLETVQKQYRLTTEDANKLREYGMVIGWLQGYVSATNAYHPNSTGDGAPKLSAGDMMNWLFSFCRNDPSADFLAIVNAINKSILKVNP